MKRERAMARLITIPAVIWAALILIPLAYLIIVSLRTQQEYARDPLGLPVDPQWDNFRAAWVEGDLAVAFLNTAILTALSVVGVVVLGTLAAYGISRWVGAGGTRFYLYFVAGLIFPFQLGLPTLYRMWVEAGLVNSLLGAVLIHVGAGLPLAVFLYVGFLRSVPFELDEAARIDGAGEIRTLASVIFPLLRPVTATVVILTSIAVWNDLLISLFFLQRSELYTLPRTAFAFMGMYQQNLPVIFAVATLSVIPILVLFVALQRFFLGGLASGALKG